MRTKILYGAGVVIVAFLIVSSIEWVPVPSATIEAPVGIPVVATIGTTTKIPPSPADLYLVTRVIDGDTIVINLNGKSTTIRILGINTPETVDPRKIVECFGKEASDKAKELLTDKNVRIEMDSTQGEYDRYGRLLAYVFRDDGLFFDKFMIEQGYAYEYTYNTPYKYQSQFKAAQASAQAQMKGLWAPGVCEVERTGRP